MLKWIINVYDPKDSSLNIHSNIYYVNDEDVKNTLCVPVVGQTITLDASYWMVAKTWEFFKNCQGTNRHACFYREA